MIIENIAKQYGVYLFTLIRLVPQPVHLSMVRKTPCIEINTFQEKNFNLSLFLYITELPHFYFVQQTAYFEDWKELSLNLLNITFPPINLR